MKSRCRSFATKPLTTNNTQIESSRYSLPHGPVRASVTCAFAASMCAVLVTERVAQRGAALDSFNKLAHFFKYVDIYGARRRLAHGMTVNGHLTVSHITVRSLCPPVAE
jgi:hypothetical protein